jgi:hypothetical protein
VHPLGWIVGEGQIRGQRPWLLALLPLRLRATPVRVLPRRRPARIIVLDGGDDEFRLLRDSKSSSLARFDAIFSFRRRVVAYLT